MLRIAFKEWAAVCRALAEGRQAVILRKGGISEEGGVFRPEHDRFWLYPTFVHQQAGGIKPAFAPLSQAAEADRPPAGVLHLTHFAEVAAVWFVADLDAALALDPFHIWTPDMVRQRFAYRSPGLYVLTVRVFAVRTPADVPEAPAYAGCKTWVELEASVEERPADPVLDDEAWSEVAAGIAAVIART